MEVAKQTDVGRIRSMNQDQIGVFYNKNESPLLLLCDGMGGHNAGDVASEMAIFQVGVEWEQTEDKSQHEVEQWLIRMITEANRRLVEKSDQYEGLAGMGTTIVAVVIKDSSAIIAHVGDSRAYLFEDHKLQQVTKDHSFVQELLDHNVISKEEAFNHPQKNIVTQTVGVNQEINVEINKIPIVEDDLLLLCSDGLTDMVQDDEIAAILEAHDSVQEISGKLVDAANEAGGKDNISVVLARVEGGDIG